MIRGILYNMLQVKPNSLKLLNKIVKKIYNNSKYKYD